MILYMPDLVMSTLLRDRIERDIKQRLAEFMLEDDVNDEPRTPASDATISLAAAIMLDFAARGHLYDYAFGEDGSIGIHSQHSTFAEFIDLLNDDRIRYSRRSGASVEQRVLSTDDAALFISSRLANRPLVSYNSSPRGVRVNFTGNEEPAQFLNQGIGTPSPSFATITGY
jgi:hypothetical protein